MVKSLRPTGYEQTGYEELARLHRYFVDWRFRILNRMYIVVAAAATGTVWLVESGPYAAHAWLPPALASAAAVGALLMDIRSVLITRKLEQCGSRMEGELGIDGAFRTLQGTWRSGFMYTLVLCGSYVVIAVAGAVVAVYLRA